MNDPAPGNLKKWFRGLDFFVLGSFDCRVLRWAALHKIQVSFRETCPRFRETCPRFRETCPVFRETCPVFRETCPRFRET